MKRFASSAFSILFYYGILWLFDLDGPQFLFGLLCLCLIALQIGQIRRRAPLTVVRLVICLVLLPIGLGLIGLSLVVATGSYSEAVVLNRRGKIVQRVPASSMAFKRPAQSYTFVPKELLQGESYEVEGIAALSNGSSLAYRLRTRAVLESIQIERILVPERQWLNPWSFVHSFQLTLDRAIQRSSAGNINDPTYFDEQLRELLSIELKESLRNSIGAVDIEILEMIVLPPMVEPTPDSELRRA